MEKKTQNRGARQKQLCQIPIPNGLLRFAMLLFEGLAAACVRGRSSIQSLIQHPCFEYSIRVV